MMQRNARRKVKFAVRRKKMKDGIQGVREAGRKEGLREGRGGEVEGREEREGEEV